jgi:hypothetical protein
VAGDRLSVRDWIMHGGQEVDADAHARRDEAAICSPSCGMCE